MLKASQNMELLSNLKLLHLLSAVLILTTHFLVASCAVESASKQASRLERKLDEESQILAAKEVRASMSRKIESKESVDEAERNKEAMKHFAANNAATTKQKTAKSTKAKAGKKEANLKMKNTGQAKKSQKMSKGDLDEVIAQAILGYYRGSMFALYRSYQHMYASLYNEYLKKRLSCRPKKRRRFRFPRFE